VFFGDRRHYLVHVPRLTNRVAVAMQNSQARPIEAEAGEKDIWLTWSTHAAVLLTRDESPGA
jgi:hypothetical protein